MRKTKTELLELLVIQNKKITELQARTPVEVLTKDLRARQFPSIAKYLPELTRLVNAMNGKEDLVFEDKPELEDKPLGESEAVSESVHESLDKVIDLTRKINKIIKAL